MTNIPQDSNNAHDIYTDPKLAEVNANDPVYDLIKSNWRQFAATVIAVFVGLYFIQSFKESYESSMQASADIFQRLQLSYKEYGTLNEELATLTADPKTADAAKIEEAKKKLAETKSRFEQLLSASADSREPYSNFSKLYRSIIDKTENTTVSKEILKQFNTWKTAGKAGSSERLTAELGAMQLARLQLENPEEASKGKDLIKDLVANAEFVPVSAAKILAGFATTESEKSEAKSVINDLIKKDPSQAELLKETLNNL